MYSELVRLIDTRLSEAGELGILVMDEDGTDDSYVSAHRNLPLATRCLIEDPVFQHHHRSQWVQLADITAYAGHQHLLQHEGNEFSFPSYPRLMDAMFTVAPSPPDAAVKEARPVGLCSQGGSAPKVYRRIRAGAPAVPRFLESTILEGPQGATAP